MKNIPFLLLIIFSICSCKNHKFQGFKYIGNDYYCSLVEIGDSEIKPGPGDYLTATLTYKTMNDSVFFHGTRKFRFLASGKKSSLDYCFSLLNPHDSMIFIFPSRDFFEISLKRSLPGFLKTKDLMKMEVRLQSIQTTAEYESEKSEFLEWVRDMKINEVQSLNNYIKNEKINIPPVKEGFYIIPLKPGNGRYIKTGDHIWISYKGKFLNGKYFDESVNPDSPIDFIFGTKMYLVEGLNQALSYLTEGEKVIIILPSSLAFGEEGSAEGIVPPFSTLIYELEIIRIE
jgi:FKBP-type peptidyl-prolyl cis-trans isomerase FkpA